MNASEQDGMTKSIFLFLFATSLSIYHHFFLKKTRRERKKKRETRLIGNNMGQGTLDKATMGIFLLFYCCCLFDCYERVLY